MEATSEDIRNDLKAKLTVRAGVTSAEGLASALEDMLEVALGNHKPSADGDFTALAPVEHEAVILLGWIEVCTTRASAVAPQPSLALRNNASGFGADRDTPFTKNMAMIEMLEGRYDKYCEKHSIGEYGDGESGDVTVGEFIRVEDEMSYRVPFTEAPALKTPEVSASPTTGAILIEWDNNYGATFASATIFTSTVAGIYESWSQQHVSGIPRIADAATQIYQTNDRGIPAVKITVAPGRYFFLLVLRDINGAYTYSKEVVATVVSTP